MNLRHLAVTSIAGLSLVILAACGSGGGGTAPSSSQAATTQVASAAPTLAALGSTAAPVATPATNPAARQTGTVQSVNGQTVMLADGTSFQLSPSTRLTRSQTATASAVTTGSLVAVTAKRQPDNTLLASMVVVFPASVKFTQQQFTEPTGDLMTNATVTTVQGNGFMVTFPGGGDQVMLAPDAKIMQILDATPADLKPGVQVSASVANGVAQSVALQ